MKKRLVACLLALLFIFVGQGAIVSSLGFEPAPYAPSSYHAYLEFLNFYEIPDNFIYYEELSFLGTFDGLCVNTDKNKDPDFTKEYYYRILPFEPLDERDFVTNDKETIYYIVRCPPLLPADINEAFDVEEMPKEQILEIYQAHPSAVHQEKIQDEVKWGVSNEFVFVLELPSLNLDFYKDYSDAVLEAFKKNEPAPEYPFAENPDYYPPCQQFWSEERRDDMIRTILYATLQQPYKNKYKAVLDSYIEELRALPLLDERYQNGNRKGFDVTEISFLGMLSSYQSTEGSEYEFGEFRFATNDPEIEIVLTVEAWDSSEIWDVPEGIPEGPDLRGEKFCLHYDFKGKRERSIYFLGDKIVVVNEQSKKKVTLTTTPQSALSEYPMVYDGGGFLSQLFSSLTSEYCAKLLADSLQKAMSGMTVPDLVWDGYQDEVLTISKNDTAGGETVSDSGTETDVPMTDDFTDGLSEPETDGTVDAPSTDGNAPDAPLTDGTDAASTDTPTDPASFPWVWVVVPAGVVLAAAATAALVIRKKKKQ